MKFTLTTPTAMSTAQTTTSIPYPTTSTSQPIHIKMMDTVLRHRLDQIKRLSRSKPHFTAFASRLPLNKCDGIYSEYLLTTKGGNVNQVGQHYVALMYRSMDERLSNEKRLAAVQCVRDTSRLLKDFLGRLERGEDLEDDEAAVTTNKRSGDILDNEMGENANKRSRKGTNQSEKESSSSRLSEAVAQREGMEDAAMAEETMPNAMNGQSAGVINGPSDNGAEDKSNTNVASTETLTDKNVSEKTSKTIALNQTPATDRVNTQQSMLAPLHDGIRPESSKKSNVTGGNSASDMSVSVSSSNENAPSLSRPANRKSSAPSLPSIKTHTTASTSKTAPIFDKAAASLLLDTSSTAPNLPNATTQKAANPKLASSGGGFTIQNSASDKSVSVHALNEQSSSKSASLQQTKKPILDKPAESSQTVESAATPSLLSVMTQKVNQSVNVSDATSIGQSKSSASTHPISSKPGEEDTANASTAPASSLNETVQGSSTLPGVRMTDSVQTSNPNKHKSRWDQRDSTNNNGERQIDKVDTNKSCVEGATTKSSKRRWVPSNIKDNANNHSGEKQTGKVVEVNKSRFGGESTAITSNRTDTDADPSDSSARSLNQQQSFPTRTSAFQPINTSNKKSTAGNDNQQPTSTDVVTAPPSIGTKLTQSTTPRDDNHSKDSLPGSLLKSKKVSSKGSEDTANDDHDIIDLITPPSSRPASPTNQETPKPTEISHTNEVKQPPASPPPVPKILVPRPNPYPDPRPFSQTREVSFLVDEERPYKNASLYPRQSNVYSYNSGYYISESGACLDHKSYLDVQERLATWEPYWRIVGDIGLRQVKASSSGSTWTGTRTTACLPTMSRKENTGSVSSTAVLPLNLPNVNKNKELFAGVKWGQYADPVHGCETRDQYKTGDVRLILRTLPLFRSAKDKKKRADTHIWPKGTLVQLACGKSSDFLVPITQRRQEKHDEKLWKGMSHMLDLTRFASPQQPLSIKLCSAEVVENIDSALAGSHKAQLTGSYCLHAAICKYVSPDDLYEQLVGKRNDGDVVIPTLSERSARILAMDYVANSTVALESDDDDEGNAPSNVSNSLTLSLLCPIMKTPMQTPVRGRQCKHLQCFDLKNFLRINESVSGGRWRCGNCEGFVSVRDLIHDGLFQVMIDKYQGKISGIRDKVSLQSDGTFYLKEENKLRYSNKVPPAASSNVATSTEIIDLD